MQAITVFCDRIQYPYIENVRDYDFVQSDVCKLLKNEDTWCRVLGDYYHK